VSRKATSGIKDAKGKIVNKLTQWTHWLSRRDAKYVAARLFTLFRRYGLTTGKAKQRTRDCVQFLAAHGCLPTFPTPGRVIDNNPEFCRELQTLGAELAVHSYDHVDFTGLSPAQASRQFIKAAESFSRNAIQFEGFRCPYLSWEDSLLDAIPERLFKYSSNHAIWWDVVSDQSLKSATSVFKHLEEFYHPQSAGRVVATPKFMDGLLEIPVSLPDDLQLYDGLALGAEGVQDAWIKILDKTFARGELFVILFHPESFRLCAPAFEGLLTQAAQFKPSVWVTRLQDVSQWWWERSCFSVDICSDSTGIDLSFDCSDNATLLVRNMETPEPTLPWDEDYRVLPGRTMHLTNGFRPFVGVSSALAVETISFLKDQGYVIDSGEQAARCSVYLDDPSVGSWSEVQLINHIESSRAPLVKYSRWPDGAKSALCVTGDLDALSLMDYASRLWPTS
jgi:peptidoglycan/xylan/chitin deacetylase (PgdA/CDA1 family)